MISVHKSAVHDYSLASLSISMISAGSEQLGRYRLPLALLYPGAEECIVPIPPMSLTAGRPSPSLSYEHATGSAMANLSRY